MTNAIVFPWPNEDVETTLKRLRRILEKSGAMKEFRRHEEFRPKSERRRSKRNAAIARQNGGRPRVRS